MDPAPHLNDPVVLRDESDRTYRSRVEGLEPGLITVARPLDLPSVLAYGPGAELAVTWSCARGIAVVPTRLVAEHAEGGLRLWSMAVAGDGWVEQRRNFVRVPANGPVTLLPRGDRPEDETVTGRLVEVSEASLRCAVDTTAAEGIDADIEVTASFGFGDHEFEIPARIGARRPGARPAERAELVVVFHDSARNADALRRQIYAQQLRALRPREGGR